MQHSIYYQQQNFDFDYSAISAISEDQAAEQEIIRAISMAKTYERLRPRPTAWSQHLLMLENFPHLPPGSHVPTLSPQEIEELRKSLRNEENDRTNGMIANLREQMAEYHDLLDKLEAVETRNVTLERRYNERESRIKALEQELLDLKGSSATQYNTTEGDGDTQWSLRRLSSVISMPPSQSHSEDLVVPPPSDMPLQRAMSRCSTLSSHAHQVVEVQAPPSYSTTAISPSTIYLEDSNLPSSTFHVRSYNQAHADFVALTALHHQVLHELKKRPGEELVVRQAIKRTRV